MRTIALVGCIVAALLIVAAVVVWIVGQPTYFPNRFCSGGVEAITVFLDRRYLGGPSDERCEVVFGKYTIAVCLALAGLVALAASGILAWVARRRVACTDESPG